MQRQAPAPAQAAVAGCLTAAARWWTAPGSPRSRAPRPPPAAGEEGRPQACWRLAAGCGGGGRTNGNGRRTGHHARAGLTALRASAHLLVDEAVQLAQGDLQALLRVHAALLAAAQPQQALGLGPHGRPPASSRQQGRGALSCPVSVLRLEAEAAAAQQPSKRKSGPSPPIRPPSTPPLEAPAARRGHGWALRAERLANVALQPAAQAPHALTHLHAGRTGGRWGRHGAAGVVTYHH